MADPCDNEIDPYDDIPYAVYSLESWRYKQDTRNGGPLYTPERIDAGFTDLLRVLGVALPDNTRRNVIVRLGPSLPRTKGVDDADQVPEDPMYETLPAGARYIDYATADHPFGTCRISHTNLVRQADGVIPVLAAHGIHTSYYNEPEWSPFRALADAGDARLIVVEALTPLRGWTREFPDWKPAFEARLLQHIRWLLCRLGLRAIVMVADAQRFVVEGVLGRQYGWRPLIAPGDAMRHGRDATWLTNAETSYVWRAGATSKLSDGYPIDSTRLDRFPTLWIPPEYSGHRPLWDARIMFYSLAPADIIHCMASLYAYRGKRTALGQLYISCAQLQQSLARGELVYDSPVLGRFDLSIVEWIQVERLSDLGNGNRLLRAALVVFLVSLGRLYSRSLWFATAPIATALAMEYKDVPLEVRNWVVPHLFEEWPYFGETVMPAAALLPQRFWQATPAGLGPVSLIDKAQAEVRVHCWEASTHELPPPMQVTEFPLDNVWPSPPTALAILQRLLTIRRAFPLYTCEFVARQVMRLVRQAPGASLPFAMVEDFLNYSWRYFVEVQPVETVVATARCVLQSDYAMMASLLLLMSDREHWVAVFGLVLERVHTWLNAHVDVLVGQIDNVPGFWPDFQTRGLVALLADDDLDAEWRQANAAQAELRAIAELVAQLHGAEGEPVFEDHDAPEYPWDVYSDDEEEEEDATGAEEEEDDEDPMRFIPAAQQPRIPELPSPGPPHRTPDAPPSPDSPVADSPLVQALANLNVRFRDALAEESLLPEPMLYSKMRMFMMHDWKAILETHASANEQWDRVTAQLMAMFANARELMRNYQFYVQDMGSDFDFPQAKRVKEAVTDPIRWAVIIIDECRVGDSIPSDALRRALIDWVMGVFLEPMLNADDNGMESLHQLVARTHRNDAEAMASLVDAQYMANQLLDQIDALFVVADISDDPALPPKTKPSDLSFLGTLRKFETILVLLTLTTAMIPAAEPPMDEDDIYYFEPPMDEDDDYLEPLPKRPRLQQCHICHSLSIARAAKHCGRSTCAAVMADLPAS